MPAPHLALPRREPGARLPPPPGGRSRRGHHLHGHPRLLPDAGPQLGGDARPGPRRGRPLRGPLRPAPARHVAGRVRLRPRLRRAAARGGHPLLRGRHPRAAPRRRAAGLRRPCPGLLPHRCGRLRARHRVVAAGLERQGGLPRRPALPRLLPGHRLRPAARLHRAARPPGEHRGLHRPQVPRHHARQAARQVGLRSGGGARPRGPARLPLPRQPRQAGGGAGRPHGPAAHRGQPVRRRALRPLVVRGAHFLNDVFRQLHFDQDTVEPITPGDYLDRHPTNQVATPSLSSWGRSGYGEYWCNESNAWIYRHLHVAGERMAELARRSPPRGGWSGAPSTRPRASCCSPSRATGPSS